MSTPTQSIPFEATHPGSLIKDEIEARGLSQKDLAQELDVLPSFLNEIIRGKRPVTADFAVLLETALEIKADYWMRLQSQFEIDKARIKDKTIKKVQRIEMWNLIKQNVPVNYFKKAGYLSESIEENISKIKTIYRADTVDDIVASCSEESVAYYRKSQKLEVVAKNIFAWSRLSEYEATNHKAGAFYTENIPSLCEKLNAVFYANKNTLAKTQEVLAQYGIILVLLQKPPKTPVDGYAFWSKNNPAIAMTLRFKRLDNFAFTLMHELGHVARHLENRASKFLDLQNDAKQEKAEKEADAFAQENLISNEVWNTLKRGPLTDLTLKAAAKKHKIHPAILLGRKCHETGNYRVRTGINRGLG